MIRTTRFTTPVFGLRREIDKLFEDTFGNAGLPTLGTSAWMPAVDVKETNDALLFDLEMPGVSEDKLEITCQGGVLAIAGEKASEKKEGTRASGTLSSARLDRSVGRSSSPRTCRRTRSTPC